MQTSNRFLDDLAKVASGAASTITGLKQELDVMVRQRVDRLVADFDLVRRDEFEAVKALAANARAEQESLQKRLADLEAAIAALSPASGESTATAAPGGAPAEAGSGGNGA